MNFDWDAPEKVKEKKKSYLETNEEDTHDEENYMEI